MSGRSLLRLAQRVVPPARSGDLVLAYHLVGGGTDSPVDISVAQFERQLDYLTGRFEFATLQQALPPALGQGKGQRARAILTFDDAFANFAEVVWPILSARRIPAVLYVPVGFVRGTAPSPLRGASLRPCTFTQLRDLANGGIEIGSHSVNHLNLRLTEEPVLSQELSQSRRVLEQELGLPVTSFCYPQAKLDRRVELATARFYDNAVAAGGRRYQGHNRFRIPRFPVRRDEPSFDVMVSSSIWLSEAVASGARQWRK